MKEKHQASILHDLWQWMTAVLEVFILRETILGKMVSCKTNFVVLVVPTMFFSLDKLSLVYTCTDSSQMEPKRALLRSRLQHLLRGLASRCQGSFVM